MALSDEYGNAESLREVWKFSYTGGQLLEGAEQQRDFRLERVEHYTKERQKWMTEARESGLEVDEGIDTGGVGTQAMSYSNVSNAAFTPTIRVRDDLQVKIRAAHMKMAEHQKILAGYEAWISVLKANSYAKLDCTYADWLYFFGKV